MIERMLASDPADNGTFIVGVRTTGIYCLPSCRPPRKPKPENVDFFATPEEARAAGLRACKLCRPDEFSIGRDASEALVEGLVAEMNRELGKFRNASAVVRASGVRASKLHELFWTYNHMMRSFGFLDCVPLGDTGLTTRLKALFALDERPDRTRTLELMR